MRSDQRSAPGSTTLIGIGTRSAADRGFGDAAVLQERRVDPTGKRTQRAERVVELRADRDQHPFGVPWVGLERLDGVVQP